jgi:2-polyprenyl-6-hydroxyphenyl methylase/3-demethylubiquinone-9 3-methyltransferase
MSPSENEQVEMPLDKRFGFGKNWSKFIETKFNEERVKSSINVFCEFTGLSDLSGKSFIDVGCGSGLHSVAASRLKAKSIFSFDFDPHAVKITRLLRERELVKDQWQVEQGSILNRDYLQKLAKYDFVYSWGVLHHTGSVWEAIENTSTLVAPKGKMYLALYSLDVQPNAEYWLAIKKKYVNSSPMKKRIMEQSYLYTYYYGSSVLKYLSGFFKKEKGRTRGMELMTDVRDWLGGWPMEFVLDSDVVNFVEKLGFKITNIKKGEACTEFLFQNIAKSSR